MLPFLTDVLSFTLPLSLSVYLTVSFSLPIPGAQMISRT